MKRIIVAFLIAGFSLASTLKLKIVDEYGNPLPGVRVILKGQRVYYGYSGESGIVFINAIPGDYSAEVKLKGFYSKTVKGVKVLPGIENFYNIDMPLKPLKKKSGEESVKIHPSPSQIWPVFSFECKEFLPFEDGKLGRLDFYPGNAQYRWNGYYISENHFLFPSYPEIFDMGNFVSLSLNNGAVVNERPGYYSDNYSVGNQVNIEWLPGESFSSDLENPYFYSVYLSTAISRGKLKTALSYSRLNEERDITGFDNRISRKGDLLYYEASYGGAGARILYTRLNEPYEIKYANFLHYPSNTPDLNVKTWDFSLFNSGVKEEFSHYVASGIRTWESEEKLREEPGIFNTKTGRESLLGNRFVRMRDYYAKFNLGIFLDNLIGASHTIFGGFNYNYLSLYSEANTSNNVIKYLYGDISYFLPDTDIRYWRVYSMGNPERASSHTNHFSIFLQDTWNFGKLVLFTGLRYDNYSSRNHSGLRTGTPEWEFLNGEGDKDIFSRRIIYSFPGFSRESFGLRFGFSYSLSRNFVFKGSLSRFGKPLDSSEMLSYFPYNNGWADLFWKDMNGDGVPSSDEVVETGIMPPPHMDEKAPTPFKDIISLGFESAFLLDSVFGAQGWIENSSNNIGIINTAVDYYKEHPWWNAVEVKEPGPDGIFGTSDDGVLTVYYFTPTEEEPEYKITLSSVAIKDLNSSSKNIRIYLRRDFRKGFSFYIEGIYTKFKGYEGSTPLIFSPNQVENIKYDYSRYSLRASFTLEPFKRTYISGFFLYVSGMPYQRKLFLMTDQLYPFNLFEIVASRGGYETSREFKTFNISVSRTFKIAGINSSIYLKIRNLFGWDSAYKNMGIQGILTTDGKFYPMESFNRTLRSWGGREFSVGLRFSF